MRVVRLSVVAAMLALVVFASASVALADGRGTENDAVDLAARAAAARVRRDDGARC